MYFFQGAGSLRSLLVCKYVLLPICHLSTLVLQSLCITLQRQLPQLLLAGLCPDEILLAHALLELQLEFFFSVDLRTCILLSHGQWRQRRGAFSVA